MDFNKIREFIIKNNSQSHLCICNTDLFESTIVNGIYGFPHAGTSRLKSFWRSVASLYNIGKNDLIFIYRTNGTENGCKEIHGPFKMFEIDEQPSIYYDLSSENYPMYINGEVDCKARFLFTKLQNEVYSIADNYELVKRYESREIWGYRHPAVMNIGAARKKSIAAFSNKQTLVFIDLLEKFGEVREILENELPSEELVDNFINIENSTNKFKVDSDFIASNFSSDEAFLYSYFIAGLKNPTYYYAATLIANFSTINNSMLGLRQTEFAKVTKNIMLEVIITTHLQDELDIVLSDNDEKNIVFFEFKVGKLNKKDLVQTEKYVDLLNAITPERNYFANLVGKGKEDGLQVSARFINQIRLVGYEKTNNNLTSIIFSDITN